MGVFGAVCAEWTGVERGVSVYCGYYGELVSAVGEKGNAPRNLKRQCRDRQHNR